MKIDETENDKVIYRKMIYQEKRYLNKQEDKYEEIIVKDIYYGDKKEEPLHTVDQYFDSGLR